MVRQVDQRDFDYQVEGAPWWHLRDGKRRLGLFCLFCASLFVEGVVSKTAVITPIPRIFQMIVVLSGFGLSIWVTAKLAKQLMEREGPVKGGCVILFMPILGAFLFYGIAWRIENHGNFLFSNELFEPASYPIVEVDCGCGKGSSFATPSVGIDPYGTGATKIPISNAQYDKIADDYRGLYVTVQQRRSSLGAIQVADTGDRRLTDQPAKNIRACDIATSPSS